MSHYRGTTCQPTSFLVKIVERPHTYYLRVGKISYKFSSVIKAVDISFKLKMCLSLNYANECAQVYLLIQKAIYKIDTEYDKVSPALSILLKELDIEN